MSITRRGLIAGAAGFELQRRAAPRVSYPRPARRADILIGYGLVNLWHTIDPERLAGLLYSAGCTLTEIEYVAWFNDAGRKGQSVETRVEAARKHVQAMRKRNITTFISLVNWNGEAQRKQDDDWFRARLKEIVDRIGTDRVILLGVSEPDGGEGGKAYRWMRYAIDGWKGRKVGNGDAGRGAPRVPGFDFVDWHHCSDFDDTSVRLATAGKPTLNNTDCGPVVNPGPERARAMARVALQRNTHFNVYGFQDAAIDEAVIRALGEEIQRAAPMPRREGAP